MNKSKTIPATTNRYNVADYLKTLSPEQLERIANHALNQANRRTKSPQVADKINSSYWWEMEMHDDQRVKFMTGYSKFEGFNEARNTDDVLAGRVEMLYKNGYMLNTRCITIYKRIGAICNRELDQVVLIITPTNWEYRGGSFNMEVFLTNFRNRIEQGIAPKIHLRPTAMRKSN